VDQVIIKDLVSRGIIGIHDWERAQEQEILINLVLFTDVSRAAASDSIADCLNYQTMVERVLAHAERVRRFTVEALAVDIARLILEEPAVQRVRVRVEKPGAIPSARLVGVEIERGRDA